MTIVNGLETWTAITTVAATAVAGDILTAGAMRRIGDLGSFDALPELVESGRRYLLDGSVGHDDLVDLPLRDALVATDTAHLQVRLDTPAVGIAQPLVDVPRKQLPNIRVIGSRRIWIIHRGFEALNMSAAAIPPSAGSEWRNFSRA